MNLNFDYSELLNMKFESELLKNKNAKPLVPLLRKYGIRGMQMLTFIADLATVMSQMKQEEEEEE